MINKELTNKSEETEILTADDKKLHQLLGGLKKVNAPKNFDFQLKARIANTKPKDLRQPFLLPFLRYALPLSVIVLLAGFVFFNLSLSNENQDVPQIADKNQPTQIEPAPPETIAAPTINDSTIASTTANKNSIEKRDATEIVNTSKKAAQDNIKYVAEKNLPRKRAEKTENNSKNDFGGTVQRTAREMPVFKSNTNADPGNIKSPSISQHKLSLREVLSGIGIQADYVENSWKILAVEENSRAMRAGLKAGDIIEAIDGKKPSSNTAFLKRFTGRMFEILRDGQPKIIDLNSK
jgi:hypothetical protein